MISFLIFFSITKDKIFSLAIATSKEKSLIIFFHRNSQLSFVWNWLPEGLVPYSIIILRLHQRWPIANKSYVAPTYKGSVRSFVSQTYLREDILVWCQLLYFYWAWTKIDWFHNPFLKIEGFHGTYQTYCNGTPWPN